MKALLVSSALAALAGCSHPSQDFNLKVDVPPGAFAVLAQSGGIAGGEERYALFPDGSVATLFQKGAVPGGHKDAADLAGQLTARILRVKEGSYGGPTPPDYRESHLVLMIGNERHDWEVTGPRKVPEELQQAIADVQGYAASARP